MWAGRAAALAAAVSLALAAGEEAPDGRLTVAVPTLGAALQKVERDLVRNKIAVARIILENRDLRRRLDAVYDALASIYVVTVDSVNCRRAPSVTAEKSGVYVRGDMVRVEGEIRGKEGRRWYRLGNGGYVVAFALRPLFPIEENQKKDER